MKYIDLHMHSTCSDGSYTPKELVRAAREKGLSDISLTDHDSIDGLNEAEAEAKRVAEMEKIAAEHAPEPVEVKVEPKEEKMLCVGFKVYGTLEQLKALKAFLIENEYKFETI